MLNCILLSLSVLLMIFCIISVIAEHLNIKDKEVFNFFRNVRITVRDLDFTAFMTSSVIVILLGLIFHDKHKDVMLFDILLLFISFLVIHGDKIIRFQKSRKHLKFKNLVPHNKVLSLCSENELSKEAKILEPIEVEVKEGE